MSADIIALLARASLALSAALVLILVLRGPLRRAFGAEIAYAFWLIAPIGTMAAFLPARVIWLTPQQAPNTAAEAPQTAGLAQAPDRRRERGKRGDAGPGAGADLACGPCSVAGGPCLWPAPVSDRCRSCRAGAGWRHTSAHCAAGRFETLYTPAEREPCSPMNAPISKPATRRSMHRRARAVLHVV